MELNAGGVPIRLGHTKVVEEHGKIAFKETFQEPLGNLTEWLLFGSTKVPVIVFAITEKDVIVLEHFRYGAGTTLLELPGGNIENGKTAEFTVSEELGQETGFKAGVVRRLLDSPTDGMWFEPASLRTKYVPFIATSCSEQADLRKPESGENINRRLFSIETWYRMLAHGEVRDSKSYAVSILALGFLENGIRELAMKGLTTNR